MTHKPAPPKNATEREETEKASLLEVKRIREAILEEVFRPGDHLGEVELAKRFKVSRSPVRETLLALEKEGTVIISPYKGAIVKPLSVAEVLDMIKKLPGRHLRPMASMGSLQHERQPAGGPGLSSQVRRFPGPMPSTL